MAAIIEQNHDDEGIILPNEIAPYDVIVIALDVTDEKIMDKAQDIYQTLTQNGIAVIFDDRDERAGVKFKDADLIGFPLQIIIGKNFLENDNIELKVRRNKSSTMLKDKGLVEAINNILSSEK